MPQMTATKHKKHAEERKNQTHKTIVKKQTDAVPARCQIAGLASLQGPLYMDIVAANTPSQTPIESGRAWDRLMHRLLWRAQPPKLRRGKIRENCATFVNSENFPAKFPLDEPWLVTCELPRVLLVGAKSAQRAAHADHKKEDEACQESNTALGAFRRGSKKTLRNHEYPPPVRLGGKKIALRGGGGMTRKPIFPTPPPSLAAVTGGGFQGGGARPAGPGGGGGGQPNIFRGGL